MRYLTKLMALLPLLFFTLMSKAQTNPSDHVEMADVLHQNGKIYLVVLVLVTIFAGILFLLIRIERRLNQLEQNKK